MGAQEESRTREQCQGVTLYTVPAGAGPEPLPKVVP